MRSELQAQLERAGQFRAPPVGSKQQIDEADRAMDSWESVVARILEQSFNKVEPRDEFAGAGAPILSLSAWGDGPSLTALINNYQRRFSGKVETLRGLIDQLEHIAEERLASEETADKGGEDSTVARKVFIVHGHDTATKDAAAAFIRRLGLDAIILHEQPNRGQTLIEKLLRHAKRSAFAVVLLTPDDVAHAKANSTIVEERARQNVVLELGLFIGLLGRERVAALKHPSVVQPSDHVGVVYLDLGDATWKSKLALELDAAGLKPDLSKAHSRAEREHAGPLSMRDQLHSSAATGGVPPPPPRRCPARLPERCSCGLGLFDCLEARWPSIRTRESPSHLLTPSSASARSSRGSSTRRFGGQ